MTDDIKRIVLTGGPCAGKTTALVRVIEHFSSMGYKVFTIPEVPTMFTQAGMDYLTKNQNFFLEGEKSTLELQLALEDKFMRMAKAYGKPAIIVCDRGAMDISAYVTPQMWERITQEVGTTTTQLRDTRYDAVLHLVSAADGAEQFYTTSNNASRNEAADEQGLKIARMLDKKVIEAWTGHPHLRVINNHENFENKLRRVIREISNVLALPQPIEDERKFIVSIDRSLPDAITSDITQTYLVAEPGCEVRLRRRTWGANFVNVHTTKKKISPQEELITDRQVSNSLYESLLKQADPYRKTIRKTRHSLVWKGQYFQIDAFHDALEGLVVLETKGIAQGEEVTFPPGISVKEEITGRTDYDNYNLALR